MKLIPHLALAFCVALPVTTLGIAQDSLPPFEQPPTRNAVEILKPEFLTGPGFRVQPSVPAYSGSHHFTLFAESENMPDSIRIDGNALLAQRVAEFHAIAKLKEVAGTKQYASALANAAKSPLNLAKNLIEHPTDTITGIPKGLWKFVNRAGNAIEDAANPTPSNPYEDAKAKELIGFSKAKRELALQLSVDPYSSNPDLQTELNRVAWAGYAGKMTLSGITFGVGGPIGATFSISGATQSLSDVLRDNNPSELRKLNLKAMEEMNVPKTTAQTFVQNPVFSPSAQTALVLALQAVPADNRASFIQLANENCSHETDVIFLVYTANLIAHLHHNGYPVARFDTLGALPICFLQDGSLMAALHWDYACWTNLSNQFVQGLAGIKPFGKTPPRTIVAISGDFSPTLTQVANSLKIQLLPRQTNVVLK